MRSVGVRTDDGAMSDQTVPPEGPSALRLWLELDLGTEPIRGMLTPPGGAASPFTGWLGLTAALDALRREPQPRKGGRR